jgi:hypothetical protein
MYKRHGLSLPNSQLKFIVPTFDTFFLTFFIFVKSNMSKRKFQCNNLTDNFCYICGDFKLCEFKVITPQICQLYEECFQMKLADHVKDWAPNKICKQCFKNLNSKRFPFETPTMWREPASHPDKCFFCTIKVKGYNRKTLSKINYPMLECCIRPFDLQRQNQLSSAISSSSSTDDQVQDPSFEENSFGNITTQQLNDMTRNLHLSKNRSTLLAKMLKETASLAPSTTYYHLENRDEYFRDCFKEQDNKIFCHDIE